MNDLEERILRYANARWPNRDAKSVMKKLGEEFFELIEAEAKGDDAELMLEAADIAILLVDLVALKGGALKQWVRVKVEILEERLDAIESDARETINEELGG